MFRGFSTAIKTLTVIPWPGKDTDNFSASMPWFPVIGLLLGSIQYGIFYVAMNVVNVQWTYGIAFGVVLAGIVLTGALHLDGLADWADSLGCSPDKTRMLAVMKDSSTGVFGALALIISILGKWISVVALIDHGTLWWLICSCVVSRTMIVYLAVRLPYARTEEGTGKVFVFGAKNKHLIGGLITGIFCLFPFLGLFSFALIGTGLFIAVMFGLWCRHTIGGVTGDLLGACSEIVELSLLLFGASAGENIKTLADFCLL